MKSIKGGDSVKINTTFEIPEGETEGLGQTLKAYEQYDMNLINDITGTHPDFDASGIGKTLKGSGKKP
jgi:hypothetical protein